MIEYACFISYRHGEGDEMRTFIEDLHAALRAHLEMYVDQGIFLDTDRLNPGYRYNEVLAQALYDSVCLVPVLTPAYFLSAYCRRELGAMLKLEQERRAMMGQAAANFSFVVPVHLAGPLEVFPVAVREEVQLGDFTRCRLCCRQEGLLRHPDFAPEIEKIATYVFERYRSLCACGEAFNADHTGRHLPPVDDVNDLRVDFNQPMPLGEEGVA
jgi:hypothetical protein